MSYNTCAVSLRDVSFAWPDGGKVISGVTAAIASGPTAVVGPNGGGKSTLLRLIAGELLPTAGSVDVHGPTAYLRQHPPTPQLTTVADALGISPILRAIAAIEAGSCDPLAFEVVGNEWDVEPRAHAELATIGLSGVGLACPLDRLSGGQATLVRLVGVRLQRASVVLLDEPSNDLDESARRALREYLTAWQATVIFASHDRQMLRLAQTTIEVRHGRTRVFPGPFEAMQAHVHAEQQAAQRALTSARKDLAAQHRQRQATETALARRARQGRAVGASGSIPRILANARKSAAEATAGRQRESADRRVHRAQALVTERSAELRRDAVIDVAVPDPHLPEAKRIVRLVDGRHTRDICGPRRVAITGPNGIGKSRLLAELVRSTPQPKHPVSLRQLSSPGVRGASRDRAADVEPVLPALDQVYRLSEPADTPVGGQLYTQRIGYLPQTGASVEFAGTAVDHILACQPRATIHEARTRLAQFALRGDVVHRTWSSMSGGERFRVTMAGLLLADPAHELMILDEPTNHLDLDSVDQLVVGLRAFHGALLVVSHDPDFLTALGIDMWVTLTSDGFSIDERGQGSNGV